jgi:hypothetical protein
MTSSRWRLELDIKKSGRRLLIGDKHKTSRPEDCSLTFLSDWPKTSRGEPLQLDRLTGRPAESECLQQKSTNYFNTANHKEKAGTFMNFIPLAHFQQQFDRHL